MKAEELEKVYETLLSVPGMNDAVKMDLKIPRKTVLLLTEVLRKGMSKEIHNQGFGMADNLSEPVLKELDSLILECLEKAGLTELSGRLRGLG
jgi:hypothetical protein